MIGKIWFVISIGCAIRMRHFVPWILEPVYGTQRHNIQHCWRLALVSSAVAASALAS